MRAIACSARPREMRFSAVQRTVRQKRQITIADEHCYIGAVRGGNVSGVADGKEVFDVGVVQQRSTPAFAKRGNAQSGRKRRRQIHIFGDDRCGLTRQSATEAEPTANFRNVRLIVQPRVRNFSFQRSEILREQQREVAGKLQF